MLFAYLFQRKNWNFFQLLYLFFLCKNHQCFLFSSCILNIFFCICFLFSLFEENRIVSYRIIISHQAKAILNFFFLDFFLLLSKLEKKFQKIWVIFQNLKKSLGIRILGISLKGILSFALSIFIPLQKRTFFWIYNNPKSMLVMLWNFFLLGNIL